MGLAGVIIVKKMIWLFIAAGILNLLVMIFTKKNSRKQWAMAIISAIFLTILFKFVMNKGFSYEDIMNGFVYLIAGVADYLIIAEGFMKNKK